MFTFLLKLPLIFVLHSQLFLCVLVLERNTWGYSRVPRMCAEDRKNGWWFKCLIRGYILSGFFVCCFQSRTRGYSSYPRMCAELEPEEWLLYLDIFSVVCYFQSQTLEDILESLGCALTEDQLWSVCREAVQCVQRRRHNLSKYCQSNLRHIDPVYRDCYTPSISATMHRITLHVFEISFCFMVWFQNYTRCKAPVHYLPFSYL